MRCQHPYEPPQTGRVAVNSEQIVSGIHYEVVSGMSAGPAVAGSPWIRPLALQTRDRPHGEAEIAERLDGGIADRAEHLGGDPVAVGRAGNGVAHHLHEAAPAKPVEQRGAAFAVPVLDVATAGFAADTDDHEDREGRVGEGGHVFDLGHGPDRLVTAGQWRNVHGEPVIKGAEAHPGQPVSDRQDPLPDGGDGHAEPLGEGGQGTRVPREEGGGEASEVLVAEGHPGTGRGEHGSGHVESERGTEPLVGAQRGNPPPRLDLADHGAGDAALTGHLGLGPVQRLAPAAHLLGIRDRAILLLGFAGGMRRSEIAALDVEDITDVDDGIDILIRRSKTDQEGAGRTIGIPAGRTPETSPVIAVHRWIRVAGLTSGPLFPVIVPNGRPQTDEEAKKKPKKHEKGRMGTRRLSAQGIAQIVQRAAKRIGLDPGEFAGHSLRAGFATEAAAQGASERAIMRQTGHRSVEMVRRYIRDGDRYRDNAATYLGL